MKQDIRNHLAKFQFKDYVFTDMRFRIHNEWNSITGEAPLRIQIGVTVALPENDEMVDAGGIEISCSINEDEQSKSDTPFEMRIIMHGQFVASEKISRDKMQHILKINGTSAMLPYLRSAVSSLSTISNIPTVVLPMINVHSLIEHSDKISTQ